MFYFGSALLPWIAFPARLFQVQEFYFTQVWKRCWKLLSSHYCYTVSLFVLHFKTTTKHLCSYFRLVKNVFNLFINFIFLQDFKNVIFHKTSMVPFPHVSSFFSHPIQISSQVTLTSYFPFKS